MKYFLYTILSLLPFLLQSQNPGDTTVVQAFTFGSPQDAEIQFPSEEKQYEKILMLYTLRCVPGGAGGLEYPCGEWDYLTYSYLFEPTGIMDSTRFEQANFLINRAESSEFEYQENPLYDIVQHTDTVYVSNDNSGENLISLGENNGLHEANMRQTDYYRQQFILSRAELVNSMGALRTLKGLALELSSGEAEIDHVSIRLQHTTSQNYDSPVSLINPTLCYQKKKNLNLGTNRFHFDQFFEWDGNSSIIVDIIYEDRSNATNEILGFEGDSNFECFESSNQDSYLNFGGGDMIDLNGAEDIFSAVDEQITISFWCYGDPDVQPINNSIVEGVNKNGRRVLNIHMPWSNGQIYWDAGIDRGGNYDRINKLADPWRYEGGWHHYAFTKNTATGEMKIYQDGRLWHSGSDRSRSMASVTEFRLGSMANNSNYYRGFMDEFRVWNKELSEDEIADWMNKTVDQNHPSYQNLLVYMDFNEDSYVYTNKVDQSPIGESFGLPSRHNETANNLMIDYWHRSSRPVVHLLTDDYNLDIQEIHSYSDTVYREPVALELFNDPDSPEQRTDLRYVWPAEETYVLDENGTQISVNQNYTNDEMLSLSYTPYYSDPFEVIERFEIGRYITPYGIGLDLGEGWTWVFDVTDYMPLLRGNKRLVAGNWQELLDLKFLFIEGTPDRDVLSIRNLQTGSFAYANSIDANAALTPDTIQFMAETEHAKLKIRNSGHGFGGNLNCSEFCPRNNQIRINGVTEFMQNLWRDDCGENPLYPQGGTWVYDRANWCPGAEVNADEYELAGVVDFNDEVVIDYHLQDGYTWNGSGSRPTYIIESQIVEYGPYNHSLDMAVVDIIAPNKEEIHLRSNPTCGEPIVKFANKGSATVNQIKVNYGLAGIMDKSTEFTDLNLAPNEEITLNLPSLTQGTWPENDDLTFYVEIFEVNASSDEYTFNNRAVSEYEDAAKLNSSYVGFIVEVRTNNNGNETSYTVTDADGNEVLSMSNLSSNTTYRDTIYTEEGCYNFTIFDSGQDGLQWWANSAQGSGYANIRGLIQQGFGVTFKGVDPDFGSFSSISFTAGDPITSTSEELDNDWNFSVFPNPASDYFELRFDKIDLSAVDVKIHNHAGQEVFQETRRFDTVLEFNDLQLSEGLYFITVRQGENQSVRKLVVGQ